MPQRIRFERNESLFLTTALLIIRLANEVGHNVFIETYSPKLLTR